MDTIWHRLGRWNPVHGLEGSRVRERRFEELQNQSGVLCAPASGRSGDRKAER